MFLKTSKILKGFTLMELLIYLGVFAIVTVGIATLFNQVSSSYLNTQSKTQLTQALRFSSQNITQAIRASSKIITASSSSLILQMNDSSKNPTEFGLENNRIYKKEGTGEKIYLTPKNIRITKLDFSYLSAYLTKAILGSQWAWSGGASSNPLNEGVGWIDFNPNSSDVRIPIGEGEFLGMAYIPYLDSYLSLNCISTNSCESVDYKVYSDNNGVLHGFAWSDNFGWLSFNSGDVSSSISYSVSISSTTGDFMGWAWSENIGWVSFNCVNPEVNSCSTVNYKVQLNRSMGTPINTVYVSIIAQTSSLLPSLSISDSYDFAVPVVPVSNIKVTAVSPNFGSGSVSLTISGSNFQNGATSKLSRSGFNDILPTSNCNFVSSSSLQNCQFDVFGKSKGFWDVIVINPDGQMGILPQGFEIQ